MKFLKGSKKSRWVLAIGLIAMLFTQVLQSAKLLEPWEINTGSVFTQLPHDPVARLYLDRCLKEQNNLSADWTGIWILDEK